MRLNSGRWKTIKSFDDLMKVKGDEPPLPGHTQEEAIDWCVRSIEQCLPIAERLGVMLALENHWGLTTRPETLMAIYKRSARPGSASTSTPATSPASRTPASSSSRRTR